MGAVPSTAFAVTPCSAKQAPRLAVMAVQGPVDGPGPIMVGYLDKFSMTGLVKVRTAMTQLLSD